MTSRSSSDVSSLKRKAPPVISNTEKNKSQRCHDLSEDDIIRSRLLYEGDQGGDDRRILTLMKTFNKSMTDLSSSSSNVDIEKYLSSLYSIEHSYRLFKSTVQMDEREQICCAIKSKHMYEEVKQLHVELEQSELCLMEVKQKRLHLYEYNVRTETINKLGTRKELRAQQAATLERKRYFEHLQQTFETT
jgi:hypothetical protein